MSESAKIVVSFSRYLTKRVIFLIITFFVIISINFFLPRLMPGTPADYLARGPMLTTQERLQLIKEFGLDKPLWEQYILYIKNILKGNMGLSYLYYPETVWHVIMTRMPYTLFLLGISYTIATIIGIILGAYAAWRMNSALDFSVTGFAFAMRSMPIFWLGMVMLYIFGAELGWFPLSGALTPGVIYASKLAMLKDLLRHSVLPMIAITLYLIGPPFLLTRSLVADALTEPYIQTALAKGLPLREVIFRHALRPVSLPLSTYTAILLGYVVGGAVFTETVFDWPGVGRLIYDAVLRRDYPLIQGTFFIIAVSVLLANFIVDLIYATLDPRIRLQ